MLTPVDIFGTQDIDTTQSAPLFLHILLSFFGKCLNIYNKYFQIILFLKTAFIFGTEDIRPMSHNQLDRSVDELTLSVVEISRIYICVYCTHRVTH